MAICSISKIYRWTVSFELELEALVFITTLFSCLATNNDCDVACLVRMRYLPVLNVDMFRYHVELSSLMSVSDRAPLNSFRYGSRQRLYGC